MCVCVCVCVFCFINYVVLRYVIFIIHIILLVWYSVFCPVVQHCDCHFLYMLVDGQSLGER